MNTKKMIAGVMAVSMLGTAAVPAYAANKEEVVYVMADPSGSVNGVYVVNIFDGGDITDHGSYSSVKLMNIDGSISQNGDEITFSSPEGQKVYYQGDLSETEIPWNISIKYYIDGNELSAAEAAGKSGSLEIRIKITENEKCDPTFYDNYALQCSFTLDTEKCSNISADGATLANVGRKKQITFTALAGCGLEKSITVDVKDFEMSAAQINGVKMNLGLDIDFDGNISDLTDGAKKLDDGANELYDGASELDGGVSDMNDGIEKLRNGIDTAEKGLAELTGRSSELTSGSAEVKAALLKIQSSLSAVSANADDAEKLTAASAEIKSGIDSLCSGISELKKNVSYSGYKTALAANGADIDALKAANAETIEQLTTQLTELRSQLAAVSNDPQY